jgi:hypothetical protein
VPATAAGAGQLLVRSASTFNTHTLALYLFNCLHYSALHPSAPGGAGVQSCDRCVSLLATRHPGVIKLMCKLSSYLDLLNLLLLDLCCGSHCAAVN